ncbi:MAG: response regulator [Devosiaceae bacterium]
MADILVMEDDILFAELLCNSLEGDKHQTHRFADASSAIAHLQAHVVDLVVSDITVHKEGLAVPDGGIKLIATVRKLSRYPAKRIPIIAISGAHVWPGMEGILVTAETLGADATLKKPFHPDELLQLINEMLHL